MLNTLSPFQIAKKQPYLKEAFQDYILWASLPTILRGKDIITLEALGFDPYDEAVGHLLRIKNHKEFAAYYGIRDLGTLTDWRKRVETDQLKNTWWLTSLMASNVVWKTYEASLQLNPAYHKDRKLILAFCGWTPPKRPRKSRSGRYTPPPDTISYREEMTRRYMAKKKAEIEKHNEEESRRLAEQCGEEE